MQSKFRKVKQILFRSISLYAHNLAIALSLILVIYGATATYRWVDYQFGSKRLIEDIRKNKSRLERYVYGRLNAISELSYDRRGIYEFENFASTKSHWNTGHSFFQKKLEGLVGTNKYLLGVGRYDLSLSKKLIAGNPIALPIVKELKENPSRGTLMHSDVGDPAAHLYVVRNVVGAHGELVAIDIFQFDAERMKREVSRILGPATDTLSYQLREQTKQKDGQSRGRGLFAAPTQLEQIMNDAGDGSNLNINPTPYPSGFDDGRVVCAVGIKGTEWVLLGGMDTRLSFLRLLREMTLGSSIGLLALIIGMVGLLYAFTGFHLLVFGGGSDSNELDERVRDQLSLIRSSLNLINGGVDFLKGSANSEGEKRWLAMISEELKDLGKSVDRIEHGKDQIIEEFVPNEMLSRYVNIQKLKAAMSGIRVELKVDENLNKAHYGDVTLFRELVLTQLELCLIEVDPRSVLSVGSKRISENELAVIVEYQCVKGRSGADIKLNQMLWRKVLSNLNRKLEKRKSKVTFSEDHTGKKLEGRMKLSAAPQRTTTRAGKDKRPKPNDESPEMNLEGVRVLIVDDVLLNRKLLSKQLENLGCLSKAASTGQEAIKRIRGGEVFDVILMDLEMPGINGIDTTLQIRQFEQEQKSQPTPVLALTAHARAAYEQSCREAGMQGYISKPFNRQQVFKAISAINRAGSI